MATETTISNKALRAVGASTITSLNQGTKNANVLRDIFADTRDWLLEYHQWNFAVRSVKLAQTAVTPVVKFDYEYSLPADFIRAISVHDSNEGTGIADHKLRHNRIEASASELWLVYVARVSDPNEMTPLFREALAAALAIECATAIVESTSLAERMEKKFEKTLRRARSSDAMSDLPDRMPVGSWLTSRTGRLMERRWTW